MNCNISTKKENMHSYDYIFTKEKEYFSVGRRIRLYIKNREDFNQRIIGNEMFGLLTRYMKLAFYSHSKIEKLV